MRKLKLQVQMSIDGYIAGPNGELDWLVWKWDGELKKYVFNLTRPVDCIIMGKNLAYNFIETWEKRLNDPATNDAFTRKMVETPKIVFSKTLERTSWKNTRLATGDLNEEIGRLKETKGRDIIVYGGVTFLSSLIQGGHVDEYNLFVNPVILGDGRSMFSNLENRLKLELVYSTHFDCGITALCYIPKKQHENSKPISVTTDSAGK
ncbi:MAG TPA: dihydrofolate reductase family protein [Bacteroidales bacterium]|jgi:dihydrofolate reductase|nr:dihydrofolate reductase family protein [Bacteroidales bacterium]